MRFLAVSKILMILIAPFLVFLLVFNLMAFNEPYFKEKFSEYGITDAKLIGIHEKILKFVKGGNIRLPDELNAREKQHLTDVRDAREISEIVLYVFIFLFVSLLVTSVFTLKINNLITNFIGKILLFGGILTMGISAALFLLIIADFSSAFENFHLLLFQKGTYTFDPASELLTNIYPGQLFMDLGIKISKGVLFTSIVLVLIGLFLLLNPKKEKKLKTK